MRQDADEQEKRLQTLRFGHNLADVLLEVRETNPEAFVNDPM